MKSWYDKEEDILGIRLREGKYWKSIELNNEVVLDISKEGSILGMEIQEASKIFSKANKVIANAKQIVN